MRSLLSTSPSDFKSQPKHCPLPAMEAGNITLIDKYQIKVGTFNFQWLFPFRDSEIDTRSFGWRSERKTRHFKRVVEVIAQLNADILILQEVQDCRALYAIVSALKQAGISGYSAYLVENRDSHTGQHVGILTRYKPTEVQYIDGEVIYSVAKNIFVRFHFRNELGQEVKLAFVGLHLIAGEQEDKRVAQATLISDFIQRNVRDDEHLVILGDMNDHVSRVKVINHIAEA